MTNVNIKYSHFGLLGFLWTLISGGLLAFIVFALYGTIMTDQFTALLDWVRPTPFMWIIGIFELLLMLSIIVTLFILASRMSGSSKKAAKGWIIILSIAIAIVFLAPIFFSGKGAATVIREGIFHHAFLIAFLEPYLLIVIMLVSDITFLVLIYRKNVFGMFQSLLSGSISWLLMFASYAVLHTFGMGLISFVGPVAVLLVAMGIYFIRPINARRASLSGDLKRLKTLMEDGKRQYPAIDFATEEALYKDAKKQSNFASFSGLAYQRAMGKMDESFEAVYKKVRDHYQTMDLATKPIAEAFGSVRGLRSDNVKITELDKDMSELENLLAKNQLDKARDKAEELRGKTGSVRDLYNNCKDLISKADSAMDRLSKLGAQDMEVEKKHKAAKKAFNDGLYKQATEDANFASDEGRNTADVYEKAKNLIDSLDNRVRNKINYRLHTDDIEAELAKAKSVLRGGSP